MFTPFLFALRGHGIPVAPTEWIGFLDAMKAGVIGSVDDLHTIGRALLCRTEADFDRFDLAFAETFEGAALDPETRDKLVEWLENARKARGPIVDPPIADADLFRELLDRLRTQRGPHHGGSKWIGTGGTSPFGHSGRAARGIRMGGIGGNRSAIQVALERRWEGYRTDRVLDLRDYEVALRALRTLTREGEVELDLDRTIRKTADNAGEIDLVERPSRVNQVHLRLLMDAGGSMAPHHAHVSRLFTAASRTRGFKSFEAWSFHNCIYGWLYRDIETGERAPTEVVLSSFGPKHRIILVGDASMAPYELFGPLGWASTGALTGLEWLRRLRARAPASVWLNPEPASFWAHPTVSAIAEIFPMFELTVDGLRAAVRRLR